MLWSLQNDDFGNSRKNSPVHRSEKISHLLSGIERAEPKSMSFRWVSNLCCPFSPRPTANQQVDSVDSPEPSADPAPSRITVSTKKQKMEEIMRYSRETLKTLPLADTSQRRGISGFHRCIDGNHLSTVKV
jgi:hypothetical protein